MDKPIRKTRMSETIANTKSIYGFSADPGEENTAEVVVSDANTNVGNEEQHLPRQFAERNESHDSDTVQSRHKKYESPIKPFTSAFGTHGQSTGIDEILHETYLKIRTDCVLEWDLTPPEIESDSSMGGKVLQNVKDDFCHFLESSKSKLVLIDGVPGVGKTTLAKSLSVLSKENKALHEFELVLCIPLGHCSEVKTFEDFAKVLQLGIDSEEMMATLGENLLFIFDGFDEMSPDSSNNPFVYSILNRSTFPHSTILVTSRPSAVEKLRVTAKVDYHYKLEGFSTGGVSDYVRKNSLRRNFESLWEFLKLNNLINICKNPLVTSIVLKILQEGRFHLPKTITDIFYKLVSGLVEHYLDPEEKASSIQLECLPESAQTALEAMCKLAIEHMITGHKCTSLVESRQFLSSFALKLSTTSLKHGFRFGLVEMFSDESVSEASSTIQAAYKFLDPSILEFLAALYLHKLPPQNQLFFLAKHAKNMLRNGFSKWLKFYYGFTGEDHMQHVSYNPTKLMISTVTDLLVYTLDLSSNHEHRYTLIECLHEAQEPSMLRKLSSKHPEVLTFSVRVDDSASWEGAVSTLINKSGSSVWHVETNDKNERTVNRLKTLTPKVKIISESGKSLDKDDSLILGPKLDSSGMKKVYKQAESSSFSSDTDKERAEKLNSFCCRAVRDILQRILPLYSKVKLKGDSSNVSYVSFLACDCFKKSFEEFVTLFPFQPVHFLDVAPKKKFAAASRESLTETERHNLEEHGGHATEVVILLKPFLRKIQFVVPDTNTEFSIVISGEIFSEEAQESLSAQLDEQEIAVVRCVEDYVPHSDNTQIVAPCLPVVQKTNGKTQVALPSPTLPPATVASVAQVDPLVSKFDEGTTHQRPQGAMGQDVVKSLQYTRPPSAVSQLPRVLTRSESNHSSRSTVAVELNATTGNFSSLLPSTAGNTLPGQPLLKGMSSERSRLLYPSLTGGAASVQNTGPIPAMQTFAEQAVGEVPSSKKQIGLKPGTVLFTSVPDRIPSDRLHPLPNEQHLIRRGGNGYIYSENVSGMTMAIKKTSYRSKEYAIITKLRHKNIMPLLAFVWGPENPENKRRYTVFHYLPKLTGDLARMVTDKEELSMSEFHKTHRYNPRVMGVAIGNLKYILSQVLEGLSYMHNLHIAHRDVKASNVLLKFFCGCDTPLLCGCDVKYQVANCCIFE